MSALENGYIRKYEAQQGFSLVELSVVLVVIAILTAGGLDIAYRFHQQQKYELTQDRMDSITKALASYVTHHQRLPCPANSGATINASNFGTADRQSQRGCLTSQTNLAGKIFAGVVPVKTLGLSDKIMFDGWGRRFSYVVDGRFVNSVESLPICKTQTVGPCMANQPSGSIKVQSDLGNDATLITDSAVYLLLSHGKNGLGGFRYFGSKQPLSLLGASAQEKENAIYQAGQSANNQNVVFDDIFVRQSESANFDDKLLFRNKSQLLLEANAIGDSRVCRLTDKVIASPENNGICKASTHPWCFKMAERLHALCLR